MGVLDFLWRPCVCPECRTPGATKRFGRVKCRNSSCPNYDYGYALSAPNTSSSPGSSSLSRQFQGNFDPGSYRMEIRYRNFRGEEQSYTGDRRTLRRRGRHISICLAPTGRRASFALKWILSPSNAGDAAESTEQAAPTGPERRVLNYHKNHHTTSPLYESLRKKYPDY